MALASELRKELERIRRRRAEINAENERLRKLADELKVEDRDLATKEKAVNVLLGSASSEIDHEAPLPESNKSIEPTGPGLPLESAVRRFDESVPGPLAQMALRPAMRYVINQLNGATFNSLDVLKRMLELGYVPKGSVKPRQQVSTELWRLANEHELSKTDKGYSKLLSKEVELRKI